MVAEEKTEKYRVLFVADIDNSIPAKSGTIVIAPSRNSWNDFGLRILIDVEAYPRDTNFLARDRVSIHGFIGFVGGRNGRADTSELRELLANDSRSPATPERLPAFFTMLPDMAQYRRLVGEVGADEARLILEAIHDMVAAEENSAHRPWLRAARESKVFQSAFLRSTEAYFAWKNAGPILQGVEFEEIGNISETLRIRFLLAGRPNEHELSFHFALREQILPKRFAIVIGKNGVGKSQTLGRIADAALRGSKALLDGRGERPSFNRILAFYPTTIASSVFPSERRRRARVWYRRFSLGSAGFGRRRQTTSDLVVQLARSVESIKGRYRFDIFRSALTAIDSHHELALPDRGANRPAFPIHGLDVGGEQELLERYAAIDLSAEPVRRIDGKTYPLSSGELSFLRFAALASLYIENGTLLLFDEPETHLHPNFISQFVALLDSLLEQTGSAAIIATHSVYFVREAFEEQVTVLRSDAQRFIAAEVPTLKTFGADVGAISYFVFGEDQPSRLAKDVEEKIADGSASWKTVFDTYKDDLSLELLGDIRANMEGDAPGADRA